MRKILLTSFLAINFIYAAGPSLPEPENDIWDGSAILNSQIATLVSGG